MGVNRARDHETTVNRGAIERVACARVVQEFDRLPAVIDPSENLYNILKAQPRTCIRSMSIL